MHVCYLGTAHACSCYSLLQLLLVASPSLGFRWLGRSFFAVRYRVIQCVVLSVPWRLVVTQSNPLLPMAQARPLVRLAKVRLALASYPLWCRTTNRPLAGFAAPTPMLGILPPGGLTLSGAGPRGGGFPVDPRLGSNLPCAAVLSA